MNGFSRKAGVRYNGRTVSVLAERFSTRSELDLSGHSTCHRVVNFSGPRELLGKIVNVRVTDVKLNSLYGTVV